MIGGLSGQVGDAAAEEVDGPGGQCHEVTSSTEEGKMGSKRLMERSRPSPCNRRAKMQDLGLQLGDGAFGGSIEHPPLVVLRDVHIVIVSAASLWRWIQFRV